MKALLVLLALAVTACGDDEPKPKPATGPLVVYERGGGFAAQPQRLVIQRDGKARLTVQTGQKITHASFSVPPDQLDDLEQALDDARGVNAPTTPTGCADCFTYTVRADGVDFDLDDASMEGAPEELKRVVGLLQQATAR